MPDLIVRSNYRIPPINHLPIHLSDECKWPLVKAECLHVAEVMITRGDVICGRPRLARVFYERSCNMVGCSHMSGLRARLFWPLALMISAD